jgi:hypothetical protein
MSNFLGNIGHITEWVVVSNLENRAVNAACDKAQGWWHDRKQHKHHSHAASNNPPPPPPPQSEAKYPAPPPPQSEAKYPAPSPQYAPQQASYMPPPPSMGAGQLLISVNHIEGLNQWGPLIVVIECNYQRYQIPFNQFKQQFTFPVNQIDYDQFLVWIQTEQQQQTVAHGEIPVRVLLNNQWNTAQQRWIPLRDNYNGPAGQILINAEYKGNYSPAQQNLGPPPPYGYGYYS